MYLILEKVMHLSLWMMKLALKMLLKTYMDQPLMGKKSKLKCPNLRVVAGEAVVTVTADMVVTEEVVVDMTAEVEIAIADTVVDVTATEAEAGIMEVAGIAIDMMTVVTAVIETEAPIVGMTIELEQNHDRTNCSRSKILNYLHRAAEVGVLAK